MAFKVLKITGSAAAGGAGTATATDKVAGGVEGRLLAIGLVYKDSPPAGTTDVTISFVNEDGPAQVVLFREDDDSDGWYYPRTPSQDSLGVDNTYNATEPVYVPFMVIGEMQAVIAGANVGDGIDVVAIIEVS